MATKRLIDANALIRTIQGTESDVALTAPYDSEWFGRLADRQFEIIGIILREPTVDAVEVVFCDECSNHGHCIPEDTFRLLRIEKPFCCVGGRKRNATD